ncbi:MAG: ketopantoate reductase family protein [Rhizobiales bacterium]|nr:ketopantoate reductase family protein [Hyphomicrobiales bacterium]
MRICILGAGSLGSAIGGTLAEAGHEVTLVARNRAHVEAVNERGLILRSDVGDRTVRPRAALDASGVGAVDLAIVLVKSRDTAAVMHAARHVVGPATVVMSLQNGLGQEDVLGEIVGAAHIVAGKTYVGGLMLAPGHVLASARGRETIVGELDGSMSPRIVAIAQAFTEAGLATVASPNILGAIWDKLLVNVATGALAAVTGLPYGDLYAVPELEATAVAAVAEAMAVARARGVAIAASDPREPWAKAGAGLPAEFRTSMLQSLDKGAPTEIDFINGAVVRAAAGTGVPTPVNATLVALVKGLERRLVADQRLAAEG